MMNKRIFLYAASLLAMLSADLPLFAQTRVTDDFSDGDFTTNPTWAGTTSSFKISTGKQLQLNATAGTSGDAALSVSFQPTGQDLEWGLWVKYSLSPSSQNFARFYLLADQSDLTSTSLNAIYLQLGGVTGSSDTLSLYRQNGSSRTLLGAGRAGTVGKSLNVFRLRVTCDANGVWNWYSDTTGGTKYTLEGTATETSIPGYFTGVYVKYTSSNVTNTYFDDFYAGEPFVDNTPPTLSSINVLNSTTIRLTFSEPVSDTSVTRLNAYQGDYGLGSPISASLVNGDPNSVDLEFGSSFQTNTTYTLQLAGIRDLAGNASAAESKTFGIYATTSGSVTINEIMADPSPQVGLPNLEWIELRNNTSSDIDLTGWTLSDGSSTATFTNALLRADSFIIICATASVTSFNTYGQVLGVASFPSLNNTGDILTLNNSSGTLMHQITYSDTWYGNSTKAQGGYTLEMINPWNPCPGRINWTGSNAPAGGTPGEENSVFNPQPDTTKPTAQITLVDSVTLKVVFDKTMDAASLAAAQFGIFPFINLTSSTVLGLDLDTVLLVFASPFQNNTTYTLTSDSVKDCWGNATKLAQSFTFSTFIPAVFNDVVIHEIMSAPSASLGLPNVEWVELRNRSNHAIKLTNWTFSDGTYTGLLPDVNLDPDSLVLLCSSTNAPIMAPYGKVIGLKSMPSLNNDGDHLFLRNEAGYLIHQVSYSTNLFTSTYKKAGGWSLEMCDVTVPCRIEGNWKECRDLKGGTPGQRNSAEGTAPREDRPRIMRVFPVNAYSLMIYLNGCVDSTSVSVSSFHGPAVNYYYFTTPDLTSLLVTFTDSLKYAQRYTISLNGIKGCTGLLIDSTAVEFGLPKAIDSSDIILNEILFNPKSGGVDYVELYNKSGFYLDLSTIRIANADAVDVLQDIKVISENGLLFPPEAYIVLTTDPSLVTKFYAVPHPEWLIELASMPGYNDADGRCILVYPNGKRLDQLNYNEKMHFSLIDDKSGVSLERISGDRPTNDPNNWTSAASTAGYGTPTQRNSQWAGLVQAKGNLTLEPESFSPDQDGYDDVLQIHFKLDQGGKVGNIVIYDADGREMKRIARQDYLGSEGTYSWDGTDTEGKRCPMGLYLVVMEYFDLKGNTGTLRKTTALVGKF